MNENSITLIELAQNFFSNLSEAEKKLFFAVSQGHHVLYLNDPEEKINPIDFPDSKRLIRSSLIVWLCQDKLASAFIGANGIGITGGFIDGDIYLPSSIISFPLAMTKCVFAGRIYIRGSEFRDLCFDGSYIPSINAQKIKTKGSVSLREAVIKGEVNLLGSNIDGDLNFEGGTFINKDGTTIKAEASNISGNIFLCSNKEMQFRSEGKVNLNNAKIGGSVFCDDGTFLNSNGTAFCGQHMKIMGALTMRWRFLAEGTVDLRGALVGRRFECLSGHFKKENSIAIIAELMTIEGPVFWDKINVVGEVRLSKTKINGQFQCDGGSFLNEGGRAFFAQDVVINGNALLHKIISKGEVNFQGAQIHGNIEFDNSRLINKNGKTLMAEHLTIQNNLFLRCNFHSDGEVNLLNSKIYNDASFTRSCFLNKNGNAIMAEGIEIGGKAYLHCIEAAGLVSFANSKINGHFRWTKVVTPKEIRLDLRHARIRTLWDDEESWPKKNHLWINELVYDQFDGKSPKNFSQRIKWLELQPDERFYPQPYEQMGKVFTKYGQVEDTKMILIAKGNDRLCMEQMALWQKIWHKFLGVTLGYGYRPFRALGFMLMFFVMGWILFSIGYHKNLILPISDIYPNFSSMVYSLDTLVPVINLSFEKFWIVKEGGWLGIYRIVHIIVGWVLTTLFLVGLSGLIKK